MSGTEFAREKERVAAIMKEKQAKGELVCLCLICYDIQVVNARGKDHTLERWAELVKGCAWMKFSHDCA